MADSMTTTVEKHYCYPTEKDNSALWAALMNKDNANPMECMALMNNGGFGGWGNNPFFYLIWMWMMRYMNGYGPGEEGVNFNNRALTQLQSTVDANHLNDVTIEAIKGNGAAIHELATSLNIDYNTISQAICGVKTAVEQVGANVGFSAERVINAINAGDTGIVNAVQNTACSTQKAILEMGYQNQLSSERQTGILGSKIDNMNSTNALQCCQQTNTLQNSIYNATNTLNSAINGVNQTLVNSFANMGYTMAQDTCQIIQSGKDNTQRIVDLLTNFRSQDQALALADAKGEISNMKQTQTLLAAINGCGCGCQGA